MKKLKRRKKINIFLKWRLHCKGKKDGKNEVNNPSNIRGKYHTPIYIDTKISEFKRIEGDKFLVIIDRLKELNVSINNFKRQRDDVILNAKLEIDTENQAITVIKLKIKKDDKSYYTATILAKKNRITEIKRKARNEIIDINKKGTSDEGEANELIKNYNADFIEELNFCREKLTIYWDSLYAECKKICRKRNCETDINGQFPTRDELIVMYEIKNPSVDFEIESYDIISLKDFEENNE